MSDSSLPPSASASTPPTQVIHVCSLVMVSRARSRKGVPNLYSVCARELKQHTGEIVQRVRDGERVIVTLWGEPVAVISPVDRSGIHEAVETEARRAERESLGWLATSEDAFTFWDNEEDEVWDEEAEESVDQAKG